MEKEVTKQSFWAQSPDDVLSRLETTHQGLSEKEAKNRLAVFGKNVFGEDERVTKLNLVISQFKSPLIFILMIAASVTLFLRDWVDSAVIILAIVVNTALGFYQENRAEEALEKLKTYIKDRVRVFRDGGEKEILAEDVVPGDIIHLNTGVRVSADARIIESLSLSVDESILTGESLSTSKGTEELGVSTELAERTNMVHAGTSVVAGSGLAVVTATGKDTQIGRIAELVTKTKREKTPLQRSIGHLAWIIMGILLFSIVVIFFLGISRGQSVFDMFLISVAMAVSAIPEALPVALTVILAVGVERLVRRKGVVRKLAAAETLGSTTVILTDKTGTLTQAKMEMKDILTYKNLLENKSYQLDLRDNLEEQQLHILKLALMNTDVFIENPKDNFKQWRLVGNAMETNLVKHAAYYDLFATKLKQKVDYYRVLEFSSKHKFSASYVGASKEFSWNHLKGNNFLAVLGAPEILLEKSKLSKDDYIKIKKSIEDLSYDGMRVIGVAECIVKDKGEVEDLDPKNMKDLQFVGVIAFYDPPRPQVADAMKKVREFGVDVVMVTGDLKGTALSIARKLGWKVGEGGIMTGSQLKAISDKELLKNLKSIKIFARVSPEDKMRIANLYKQSGEVVAMTGDGVNDAPGLKSVDIGVAVGSGTDVAKAVADLVLLDDNFQTIVAAIEEGRRILSNIKKTLVYLLSNSLDEVLLIGGSLFFGLPLPLTALQILWVNFFSDSIPALAFAFEENYENHLDKKNNKVLDKEVLFLILVLGILTSALLFILYWYLLRAGHEEGLVRSFMFALYGIYILFLSWPLRSLKKNIFQFNPFSNKWILIGISVGLILMATAIYVPFFQNILNTQSLSLSWIGFLSIWLVINIALVEITKWFFRKD